MSRTPTLFEAFQRHLHTHPEALLYRYLLDGTATGTTQEWSFADTHAHCGAVGQLLSEHGLRGKRALLLYPPGLDYISTFLGCLFARTIAVPAYPPNPARLQQTLPRLVAITKAADIDVVLTTSTISDLARPLVAGTPLAGLPWLCTNELEPCTSSGRWLDAPAEDEVAYLQFTSGSTSDPKGVMVTHGNVAHNSIVIRDKFGSGPDSHGVIWLPPYHDMGLVGGILQPLYVGFSTTLMSPIDFLKRPTRWLDAISRFGATISGGPDFAYSLCARRFRPGDHPIDLSSWQLAFNGAEPIRPETLAKFCEVFAPHGFAVEAFYPCYGLAEATLMVTGGTRGRFSTRVAADKDGLSQGRFTPSLAEDALEFVSCGEPTDVHRVAVVDPQTRRRVDPGIVGEIWVSGPSIAAGYWGRPEATQACFEARIIDDPDAGVFMRTGDLGFLVAGELYVTGRLKDLIIVRGRNHYPQDIEATVAAAHSAIRTGNVVAYSVELEGEPGLGVTAEVRSSSSTNFDEVIAAIRTAVSTAHGLGVSDIALVKSRSIPKTSSGKLMRSACRESVLAGSISPVSRWLAGGPTESPVSQSTTPAWSAPRLRIWLREQLAKHTGLASETIDDHRPLAEYGLDSQTSVEITGELESLLGQELSPTLVWDHPTIDAIATYASTLGDPTPSVSTPAATAVEPVVRDDAIAIVAIGCRLPGQASGLEQLAQLLFDGRNPVSGIPESRWIEDHAGGGPASRFGAFVDGVEQFDASFFRISPREAQVLDPQQRMLLEASWEALDRAGLATSKLAGSSTGVFVGLSSNDYYRRQDRANAVDPHYSVTGNMASVAAGRLAYCFGLAGPALAVDTACSSSLVALHLACQSLRAGDCDQALTGGVNLILSPEGNLHFEELRALSERGRCASFDADADGYVRSEGCVMVVLERLADAQARHAPILAVIRGSAVNHDGRSNGLTAPSGAAQEAVIRKALERARVDPAHVGYVEAHGTGTSLGDPIELRSLDAVYGGGRSDSLLVGSIKSNIGHTEAAAGVTGLVKVVLAMAKEQIPANLHFRTPTPHYPWSKQRLRIVDEPVAWPRVAGQPRIAGLSSFGFSGTNAHLILQEPPLPSTDRSAVPPDRPQLVVVAAHGRAALEARVADLSARCRASADGESFEDLAFSISTSGSHLRDRIAVVASSPKQLSARLEASAAQTSPPRSSPKLGFLFTGQGATSVGMGSALAQRWPVCANVLERCEEVFRSRTGVGRGLREVMWTTPEAEAGEPSLLSRTEYTQPATFAFQAMLVALWRELGVEPDCVIGHSVGEYAAAYCAGVLGLEDAMTLVVERGRCMSRLPAGGMATICASEVEGRLLLRDLPELSLAAVNSPRQVVVAGPSSAIDELERALQNSEFTVHRLAVSHAFHSPLMKPMVEEFAALAGLVHHAAPKIPVVSSVTGTYLPETRLSAQYWANHICAPVRFKDALETAQGVDIFVEIGPHAVLSSCVRSTLADRRIDIQPSCRRGRGEDQALLEAVARLIERGVDVDFDRLFASGAQRVALPSYPWQHHPFWLELPERTAPRPTATQPSSRHSLVQRQIEIMNQQLHVLQATRKTAS